MDNTPNGMAEGSPSPLVRYPYYAAYACMASEILVNILVFLYWSANHLTCLDIHTIIVLMHHMGCLELPGRTSELGYGYADIAAV